MKAFQIFSTEKSISLKNFSAAFCRTKLKPAFFCMLLVLVAEGRTAAEENSLSMPSMPEISGPSLSMPSMPQIQPNTEQTQPKNTPSETANAKNSGKTLSGTNLTASTLSKLSSESGLSTLSSLLGGNSLSGLSSLYGTDSTLNAAQGLLTNGTNDSVLLAEILEKLNSIAENLEKNGNNASAAAGTLAAQDSAETAAQTASGAVKGAASDKTDKKEQTVYKGDFSITRFKVCGHNLLSSFKEIYFSKPEEDGSFLLTIDRSYSDGSRPRTETVYLFFTPDKSMEKGKFQLTIELMQDFENQNSFLYRLKEASPYTVKKTGNTYSLISKSKDFSAELLITQM